MADTDTVDAPPDTQPPTPPAPAGPPSRSDMIRDVGPAAVEALGGNRVLGRQPYQPPKATPPEPRPVPGVGKSAAQIERDKGDPKRPNINLTDGYGHLWEKYEEWSNNYKAERAEARKRRDEADEADRELSEEKQKALAPGIERVKRTLTAEAPPTPGPMHEPEMPDLSPRPFLQGNNKKGTIDQLTDLANTIGLIAQMGGGLARGFGLGAQAAYTGALNGWAEGDTIRADREWRTYLLNLDKAKRDYDYRWKKYETLYGAWQHEPERAKAMLMMQAMAFEEPQHRIELAHKSADEFLKDVRDEGDFTYKAFSQTAQIQHGMLAQQIQMEGQANLEQHRRRTEAETGRHNLQTEQNQRERNARLGAGGGDKRTTDETPVALAGLKPEVLTALQKEVNDTTTALYRAGRLPNIPGDTVPINGHPVPKVVLIEEQYAMDHPGYRIKVRWSDKEKQFKLIGLSKVKTKTTERIIVESDAGEEGE